jgi:hypothetical protein
VTVNNNAGPLGSCNWNEKNVKDFTRNDWRASLVPAAAVIPAPIAYIKVVAVKKLVVGGMTRRAGGPQGSTCRDRVTRLGSCCGVPLLWCGQQGTRDYFEEIREFKAGRVCLNRLAWNNGMGLWSCFVGQLVWGL